MLRTGMAAALAALALGLGGCEGRARSEAAGSAERLLSAARSEDRVAFEAEIDRRAVRQDLRRQIVEVARAQALDVDGGPSDFVLDRMIGPAYVRLLRLLDGPADAEALERRMESVGRNRVCLRAEADAEGACLLTFAKGEDRWRLVGMQAVGLGLPLPDPPAWAGLTAEGEWE